MQNQKKLRKYSLSFIDALSPYLRAGFQVSATIHPAIDAGAIIEFEISEGKRQVITIVKTVQRINDALAGIDQRMIGGNIQGVTFRGTNLYMEDQRIVVVKGEDGHQHWNNKAVSEDVSRVVSPRGGRQ